MSTRKRKVLFVLLIVFISLVGVYLFGVFMFSGRFPFRSYINGMNITMSTPTEVAWKYDVYTRGLSVSFVSKDGYVESVPFSNLGIYRTDDRRILDVKLNAWTWPVSIFKRTDYDVSDTIAYYPDLMESGVDNLRCLQPAYVTYPKDAYVYETDDGRYAIMPEVVGNLVDRDKLLSVLQETIKGQTLVVDLEASGCYIQPDILSTDPALLNVVNTCNNILDLDISIDVGCGIVEHVSEDLIRSCLHRISNDVTVVCDPLHAFARSLSQKYNTAGTIRTFQTSYGNAIRIVPSATDNFTGWYMDIDKLLVDLDTLLLSHQSGQVEVSWLSKGAWLGPINDFGNTYIEISINDQHMWFYFNGKCVVDTDVTTGKDDDSLRTPKGMFHILNMYRDYVMHGPNNEYTASCDYFIQVTGSGVGIHDSSWRVVYGGDQWIDNGSHGCINTPYDKVAEIFETLESHDMTDIPVIIY